MKQEYGRSLIEIIGVMAIAGLMSVATIGMYRQIRTTQIRTIANAELEQIVKNVKLLTGARGTYDGVSVDYLVKAGALKSTRAPIGGDTWTIVSGFDGASFSINLTDLTPGECAYFSTKQPTWATSILVNGAELVGDASNCFSTNTNQISFVVE
jgi:hypothetical protein